MEGTGKIQYVNLNNMNINTKLVKNGLKRVRASQPFNALTTSTVRWLMSVSGLQSEAVIKHLHRVGKVECKLPNGRVLKLWSRGDDWISNQIYWRGWNGFESEVVPLFFRLASKSRTTLDVGSYVGLFSLLAAHANPKGRIYAFEPMPRIFKRLKRNVSLNRLRNVQCTHSAVGETEGEAVFFHIADGLPSSSSLSNEFMQDHMQGKEKVLNSIVSVITLDRFVEENKIPSVDLMKIDTETTEPQVMRGMIKTLQRDHPHIVCEVLPGHRVEGALMEILLPLGYRFYLLTNEGAIPHEKIEAHPQWRNYFFTTLDADAVSQL